MQNRLPVAVCENAHQANKGERHKCQTIDVSTRVPLRIQFNKGEQPRERNDEEKRAGKIPVGNLTFPNPSEIGNPRYAINEIQLEPKHEHLRDTVYWSLIRKLLLFEDKEGMETCQKWFKERNAQHPHMIGARAPVPHPHSYHPMPHLNGTFTEP